MIIQLNRIELCFLLPTLKIIGSISVCALFIRAAKLQSIMKIISATIRQNIFNTFCYTDQLPVSVAKKKKNSNRSTVYVKCIKTVCMLPQHVTQYDNGVAWFQRGCIYIIVHFHLNGTNNVLDTHTHPIYKLFDRLAKVEMWLGVRQHIYPSIARAQTRFHLGNI